MVFYILFPLKCGRFGLYMYICCSVVFQMVAAIVIIFPFWEKDMVSAMGLEVVSVKV